jgi:hypothetical protein
MLIILVTEREQDLPENRMEMQCPSLTSLKQYTCSAQLADLTGQRRSIMTTSTLKELLLNGFL